LERTLVAGAKNGKHLIVVSHHPAFLTGPTEPHQYWNWPMNARNRLLSLLHKSGVKHMLCGHTHTTTNRTVDGLSIYTVAGTARAFDSNGCGFSVLTISAEKVEYAYTRHDSWPGLTPCSAGLFHPDFDPRLGPLPPFHQTMPKSYTDLRWLSY
jgi:3',5'-cyclic AMP phosphodiesterase CpdA